MRDYDLQTVFLRAGLGQAFCQRWGPFRHMGLYGKPSVAWGDMTHFLSYVGKLNPWFPHAMVPALGWATIAEIALGVLLLLFRTLNLGTTPRQPTLVEAAGLNSSGC